MYFYVLRRDRSIDLFEYHDSRNFWKELEVVGEFMTDGELEATNAANWIRVYKY
jgi:hypothetical protein